MVDGHLVRCTAQPAIQGPNGRFKVHLALYDVFVGTKGALEALGEGGAFFGLDLYCDRCDERERFGFLVTLFNCTDLVLSRLWRKSKSDIAGLFGIKKVINVC